MKRLKHFLRLIMFNPELASYVRELHVVDNSEDTGWATKTHILPRFLQKLRNLHSFSLIFGHMSHVAWSSLNPALQTALTHLFQSNNLKALNLSNMCFDSFPVASLDLFSRLQRLGIVSCSHSVHANYPPLTVQATHSNITHLESLELGGSISTRILEALTRPQSHLTVSQLRQLSVKGGDPETLEAACNIIRIASNTIDSFLWIFPEQAICE